MTPIRTLVVDDNLTFLASAIELISSYPEFRVVGQAPSACEALRQIALLHPDLVLIDMIMPGVSGLEATRLIKSVERAPRVIICTLHTDKRYEEAATAVGADGFLPKSAMSKQLLPLVQALFGTFGICGS